MSTRTIPRIMKGQEATVMTNGQPRKSSMPKPETTARPVDRTPTHPTQTLLRTLSNLHTKEKQSPSYIIAVTLFILLLLIVLCDT